MREQCHFLLCNSRQFSVVMADPLMLNPGYFRISILSSLVGIRRMEEVERKNAFESCMCHFHTLFRNESHI